MPGEFSKRKKDERREERTRMHSAKPCEKMIRLANSARYAWPRPRPTIQFDRASRVLPRRYQWEPRGIAGQIADMKNSP